MVIWQLQLMKWIAASQFAPTTTIAALPHWIRSTFSQTGRSPRPIRLGFQSGVRGFLGSIQVHSAGLALAIWHTLSFVCFAQLPQSPDLSPECAAELRPGIVIESVAKSSESKKAGLAQGDILVTWSRGEVRGKVSSPFDLSIVETEQEPKGPVTLYGLRAGIRRTWVIGADEWGIKARPNLPNSIFSAYLLGRDQIKAGKLADAGEKWRTAKIEVGKYRCGWLSSWFSFDVAKTADETSQWAVVDGFYAISGATHAGVEVRAILLHEWASSFYRRGDLSNAEKYYQQELVEREKESTNIATADTLNNLGTISQSRNDLKEADDYFGKARSIEQRMAPDSLNMATTLVGLGMVAENRGELANAEDYFLEGLHIAERLTPRSLSVAEILNNLGSVAWLHGDLYKAEKYLKQALAIKRNAPPTSSTLLSLGPTLNNLGNLATDRGALDEAEKYFRQSLAIYQHLSTNSLDVSTSLTNLGATAYKRGNLDDAERYLKQAWEIRRKTDLKSLDAAKCLMGLGNIVASRGDLDLAETYLNQSLQIVQEVGPESLEAAMNLNGLGDIAEARGQISKAEIYFGHSLQIEKSLAPNSAGVAYGLNNLGVLAYSRGELSIAENYYRESLRILTNISPNSLDVAENILNLGDLAVERRDLHAAETFFQESLTIGQKAAPGGLDVASSFFNLGNLMYLQGNLASAESYYLKSLAIRPKIASDGLEIAATFNALGDIARDRKNPIAAEEYYSKAQLIWRRLSPNSQWYAESLAALAEVVRDSGRPTQAVHLYGEALDVFDNQLANFGGSREVRSTFRSKHTDYYISYADLLVEQKKSELAFEVLERSRARTSLELLASAHIDIRQGAPPALLDQERLLLATLKAKTNRKVGLLEGKHSDKQLAEVNQEIDAVLKQYQHVEGQIRTSSPRYAALTQPQPLWAKEVQQEVLDSDTVLLEYALGEKRSLVFLVTPTSLDAYELPKRADIEICARQVYESLTSRGRSVRGETARQRTERIAKAEAEYHKASLALSQMILGPVTTYLGHKRLLVVTDGGLAYIPFQILPIPGPNPTDPAVSLIAEHEIVNLPSASVLAMLRQQTHDRKEAPKEVAVLADPVFDRNDPRVADKKQIASAAPASGPEPIPALPERLLRSLGDVGGEREAGSGMPRLVFTRKEADSVIATTDPGTGMEALDFQANRNLVLSKELGQYRIVHFATHGLLDNEHPDLSGLVFSLVDEQGNPQNGFLDLEDIYNLDLPVDVVVLSACETALGKEIRGEGLVGLTRGFMYAGAPRVVASLWKVDDAATADLMTRFYKAMLHDHLRPAAALRQAQLDMSKEKRWTNPYNWAAFTIQGEWK